MKRTLKTSFALGATAALAALSLAVAGELEAFLTAEMPKSKRAFETKNVGYFEAVSTPDFTYTDIAGKTQKKKEAIAGLKMMFDQSQSIKATMKLVSITENAGGGIVVVDNHYDTVTKPGPDKKSHRMEMSMTTKETWVKSGRKFKLKKIVETKVGKMLMDGKPMPAGGPPPQG